MIEVVLILISFLLLFLLIEKRKEKKIINNFRNHVVNDIERIGDHAVNIAETVLGDSKYKYR